jgi:hypothetical protein
MPSWANSSGPGPAHSVVFPKIPCPHHGVGLADPGQERGGTPGAPPLIRHTSAREQIETMGLRLLVSLARSGVASCVLDFA